MVQKRFDYLEYYLSVDIEAVGTVATEAVDTVETGIAATEVARSVGVVDSVARDALHKLYKTLLLQEAPLRNSYNILYSLLPILSLSIYA